MSFPTDLAGTKGVFALVNPVAVTTTGNGSGVDVGNTDSAGTLVVHLGAVSGTSPTLAIKLQESRNNNSADATGAADAYADISGAVINLTDANASTIVELRVNNRSKRYIRAVKTAGGTSPSFTCGVTFIADTKSF